MTPPFVVFAVLDALPHSQLSAALTPTLWALANEGGHATGGGRSVLSASTYPNHATFVTGVGPEAHRIYTSKALVEGEFVPAQDVGPAAPTIFDRCRSRDRRAVAAVGDQNLIGVCGAAVADAHWPPGGKLPEDAPRGRLGFGADRAVATGVDSLDLETADLLFLQLDEIDTIRHLHGATSEEAHAQCRETDAVFGAILERTRSRWDETVVIAVSDHDHEPVRPGAIDLAEAAKQKGLDVRIDHDGTAAAVYGEVSEAQLLDLPGVVGSASIDADCSLVWGEPGQQFGIDWGLKAHHGSPRTSTQLAVVGGGHPEAPRVAQAAAKRPHATWWAHVVSELLGISG